GKPVRVVLQFPLSELSLWPGLSLLAADGTSLWRHKSTMRSDCAPKEVSLKTNVREVVAALEQALIRRIGEPRYNLWFARNTKLTWQDDLFEVGVPNLHCQEYLERKFTDTVRAAAAEVLGAPMRVRFTI